MCTDHWIDHRSKVDMKIDVDYHVPGFMVDRCLLSNNSAFGNLSESHDLFSVTLEDKQFKRTSKGTSVTGGSMHGLLSTRVLSASFARLFD